MPFYTIDVQCVLSLVNDIGTKICMNTVVASACLDVCKELAAGICSILAADWEYDCARADPSLAHR